MRRRSTGLILAIVLALAGTVGIVSYVRSADERAVSDEELVDVFVVNAPIARGTAALDFGDRVERTEVPARVRADGAVSSLDELEGLTSTVDLVEGEQLVSTRFSATGLAVAEAVSIPEGWMSVTVELSRVRALNGALAVGDSVAAVASFNSFEEANDEASQAEAPVTAETAPDAPIVVFTEDRIDTPTASGFVARHALVVDVSSTVVKADGDSSEATPSTVRVTLAMAPDDIEQIVFAAEFGTLWLAHDPEDAANGTPGPESRDSVFLFDPANADLASRP